MGELSDRRSQTLARIENLREKLSDAEKLAAAKACVYVTGSFGRCEASPYSDLDLFILGKSDGKEGKDGKQGSLLKRLDEICIKADLIEVTRQLLIPEFSGDGRWLVHYSVHELTKTLGTSDDDVTNTFTARLLLLLESRPLLDAAVYDDVTKEVISAYWRDFDDHRESFIPAFLANDILRLWRTFCVNYEARTVRVPEDEKAKGKLKNYKLKHSRLLTCFTALLYLLAVYGRARSVTPSDAFAMNRLTPTQRLEWLLEQPELSESHATIDKLLEQYDRFLVTTNAEEKELLDRFRDKDLSSELMESAYKFGDTMYEALMNIGEGNRFHRLLVV